MIAVDEQYETLRYTWRRETIYDTVRRCWVTTDLSPLRWGTCAPAEPDATIDAYAAEFRPAHRDAAPPPIVCRLEGTLRQHGPQTRHELATLTDLHPTRIQRTMERYADIFAKVGKDNNAVYWGLVGEHDDWQPDMRANDRQALDVLRAHGELSTVQLEQLGVSPRALYRLHEQGLIARRGVMHNGHIAHYWSVADDNDQDAR